MAATTARGLATQDSWAPKTTGGHMKHVMLLFVAAASLAACARSSVMPLSADTVQISTRVAPVCRQDAAQTIAIQRAAVETINRGFDKFIVLNANTQSQVVGYTPASATTTGSAYATSYGNSASVYGNSTTSYTPSTPMIAHTQSVVIKMFRENDPAGANALSARSSLGPDWQKLVKESSTTTC